VQQSLGKISEQIALLQEAQASEPAPEPTAARAGIPAPAPSPPPATLINGWRHPLREVKYRVNKLNRLQHYEPKPLRLPPRYGRELAPADPPTISIVTPSYNQGRFIAATVASVLSQDYPALEYVVQDGGSDDETQAALGPWIDRLHHFESAPDQGQAQAINLGFAHTGGEVMAYLNSDDLLLPGTLAYVGRYFAEHPDVDVLYGQRVTIDRFGEEIGRWVLPPHDDEVLSWVDYVPQETLFWRRSVWERIGGIDEGFRFAMDWDMLIRFRDAGARIVRVPRFLGAFRIHDRQKTAAINQTHGLPEMEAIRTDVHSREVSQREILEAIRPYLRRHVLLDRLYRMRLLRY
jgi:glycosyltransferase involved in cell wall biosynthesis